MENLLIPIILTFSILPGLIIAFQQNGKYRMIFFSIAIGINISKIAITLIYIYK